MPPRRLLTLLTLLAPLVSTAGRAATPVNFNREILPILSDACFHCHGPDAATREAKLRLDERDGLFRTRDGVTVVKPGDARASELFLRIISQHEDEVMPPPKATRKLTPAEVDLLRRWIEAGAPWGGHWAYEAPRRPAVPAGFGSHAVDAFVRERLAKEKLTPAPEAGPAALVRRVSLDLTGLPRQRKSWGRIFPTARRALTSAPSTACWLRRVTGSGGRGTGSMRRVTPTRTDSREIPSARCGPGATGW